MTRGGPPDWGLGGRLAILHNKITACYEILSRASEFGVFFEKTYLKENRHEIWTTREDQDVDGQVTEPSPSFLRAQYGRG
jgi:hypothetical protein